MGRWQPDARGRLGLAALELSAERGYEQVTVAEIAERAGLTARTFFRYFTDKREVLFAGSDVVAAHMVRALADAPETGTPLDVVAAALDAVARVIGQDHAHSRTRHAIIGANAELQERELAKLASWSRLMAEALSRRGVAELPAKLAAETGVAVFRVAFDRWVAGPGSRTLSVALREALRELRVVAGA